MKAFIDDYRSDYGVEPICKVLPIAPSTYYLHAARRANPALRSTRAKQDEGLSIQIRRVWGENFQAYGVPVRSGGN
jgi:putative transposase